MTSKPPKWQLVCSHRNRFYFDKIVIPKITITMVVYLHYTFKTTFLNFSNAIIHTTSVCFVKRPNFIYVVLIIFFCHFILIPNVRVWWLCHLVDVWRDTAVDVNYGVLDLSAELTCRRNLESKHHVQRGLTIQCPIWAQNPHPQTVWGHFADIPKLRDNIKIASDVVRVLFDLQDHFN